MLQKNLKAIVSILLLVSLICNMGVASISATSYNGTAEHAAAEAPVAERTDEEPETQEPPAAGEEAPKETFEFSAWIETATTAAPDGSSSEAEDSSTEPIKPEPLEPELGSDESSTEPIEAEIDSEESGAEPTESDADSVEPGEAPDETATEPDGTGTEPAETGEEPASPSSEEVPAAPKTETDPVDAEEPAPDGAAKTYTLHILPEPADGQPQPEVTWYATDDDTQVLEDEDENQLTYTGTAVPAYAKVVYDGLFLLVKPDTHNSEEAKLVWGVQEAPSVDGTLYRNGVGALQITLPSFSDDWGIEKDEASITYKSDPGVSLSFTLDKASGNIITVQLTEPYTGEAEKATVSISVKGSSDAFYAICSCEITLTAPSVQCEIYLNNAPDLTDATIGENGNVTVNLSYTGDGYSADAYPVKINGVEYEELLSFEDDQNNEGTKKATFLFNGNEHSDGTYEITFGSEDNKVTVTVDKTCPKIELEGTATPYTRADGNVYLAVAPLSDDNAQSDAKLVIKGRVLDANFDYKTGYHVEEGVDGVVWAEDPDDEGYYTFTYTVSCPAGKVTAVQIPGTFTDKLGNTLASVTYTVTDTEETLAPLSAELSVTEGGGIGTVYVDRERPTVTPPKAVMTLDPSKEIYSEPFEVTVSIEDIGEDKLGSGIASIEYSCYEGVFGSIPTVTLDDSASTDGLTINWLDGKSEVKTIKSVTHTFKLTPNAETEWTGTFQITVTDNSGNIFRLEKDLKVDTKDPEVEFEISPELESDSQDVITSSKAVTITAKITDQNFDPQNSKLSYSIGEERKENSFVLSETDGSYTCSVEIPDTGGKTVHDISIEAFDLARHHKSCPEINQKPFIVDTQDPKISVKLPWQQDTEEQNPPQFEKVYYYQTEQTVKLQVEEDNFDPNHAFVVYSIGDTTLYAAAEDADVTLPDDYAIPSDANRTLLDWVSNGNGEHVATLTFDDTKGQAVHFLYAEATDNAELKGAWPGDDASAPEESFVVDTEKPVIKVDLSGTASNTYNNVEYFGAEREIKVTVADYNFNENASYVTFAIGDVKYYILPETLTERPEELVGYENYLPASGLSWNQVENDAEDEGEDVPPKYSLTFTVQDTGNNKVHDLVVHSVDKAAWEGSNPENAKSMTPFIVDTVAPVVSIGFGGENVEYFFVNGDKLYLKLKTPVTDDNKNEETIKINITIEDDNLTPEAGGKEGYALSCKSTPEEDMSVTSKIEPGQVKYTIQSKEIAANEMVAIGFDCRAIDLAGHIPTGPVSMVIKGEDPEGMNYYVSRDLEVDSSDDDETRGHFGTTLYVDRRQPTSGTEANAPEITVTPNGQSVRKVAVGDDEIPLFDGNLSSFSVTITDGTEDCASGLRSVEWTLDDGLGGVYFTGNETQPAAGQTLGMTYDLTIPVEKKIQSETNTAKLTVTAEDNVGNTIKLIYPFALDNLNPRITIEKVSSGDEPDVLGENKYYQTPQTLRVKVEDINFDPNGTTVKLKLGEDTYEIFNGEIKSINSQKPTSIEIKQTAWSTGNNTWQLELQFNETADLPVGEMSVSSTDLAHNLSEKKAGKEIYNPFVVDSKAPEISITLPQDSSKDSSNVPPVFDKIDYYKERQLVTVRVTEYNFDTTDETAWQISFKIGAKSYTINANQVDFSSDENVKVEQPEGSKNGWVFTEEDNKNVYTLTLCFSDTKDQPVQNFKVAVTDKSGRSKDESRSDPFVVDEAKPEITVTLGEEVSNTYNRVEYFGAEREIKVTVADYNFNENASYVTCVIGGGKYYIAPDVLTNLPEELAEYEHYPLTFVQAWTQDGNDENGVPQHSMTFKMEDTAGKQVTEISVYSKDKADNSSERNCYHLDEAQQSENTQQMPPFIVDTVAPVVSITLSDNVQYFFVNGDKLYLKLQTPVTDENKNKGSSGEEVAVTITITDVNLTSNVGGEKNYALSCESEQAELDPVVIASVPDSAAYTYTYTIRKTVEVNKMAAIDFDCRAIDLAGHIPTVPETETHQVRMVIKGENNDGMSYYVSRDLEVDSTNAGTRGHFGTTLYVDRRQPTSGTEKQPPEILIKPNRESVGTVTVNGMERPLFDGTLTAFNLTVQDGDEEKAEISGLRTVEWTLSDGLNGTYFANSLTNTYTERTIGENYTVPVEKKMQSETNTASLTVKAVDNVGNTIEMVYPFALDNLAPRVTVTYDNNDVRNERYFRAVRTATVSVEDLNFNPASTQITTEVAPSGWTQNGIRHTATCYYGTDGEYTFAMSSTDLAGNLTPDGSVTYQGAAAKDFVIDLTAPVISVSYDNNSALNGKYYNAERTATVSIREVNFRAADVEVKMSAALQGKAIALPAVNGWSGATTHMAAIDFAQDGDYTLDVDYTDLAGNPAQHYGSDIFTIDTVAPEIVFSNVADQTPYPRNIQPNVTFTDINFNDKGYQVDIDRRDISGSARYSWNTTVSDIPEGVSLNYADLDHSAANDGIYTMRASATDLAGNTWERQIVFSVNRNGSVYYAGNDETQRLLDSGYSNQATPPAIVITEINPNRLNEADQSVTVSVRGKVLTLTRGVDYSVKQTGGAGKWYQYDYSIEPSVFMEDGALMQGNFTLMFHSVDEAGNKNSNSVNSELEINFTLDTDAPTVTISGVEHAQQIRDTGLDITVGFRDDYNVSCVEIYINGELYKRLEGEELASANGSWIVHVEQSDRDQEIYVVAKDNAGNEVTTDRLNFYLNNNIFLQFFHNRPLFFGSIGGLLLLILLIIFLVKRKKKEE